MSIALIQRGQDAMMPASKSPPEYASVKEAVDAGAVKVPMYLSVEMPDCTDSEAQTLVMVLNLFRSQHMGPQECRRISKYLYERYGRGR